MWEHTRVVEVLVWGERVGAIAATGTRGAYTFEYEPAWKRRQLDLAPELMPVADRRRTFSFPGLNPETFQGLPPMIADSLPDRFGNAIVDAYLSRQGLNPDEATALDRLAYLGPRGLGALEYRPDQAPHTPAPTSVDLSELITAARAAVEGSLASEADSAESLQRIINVGTSAGGARAKAIVNLDPSTMELRSGHVPPEPGFEPWLLKFDGVRTDKRLGESENYGRVEYAYSVMARSAGVDMAPTRLLHENGRAHFMTRRFDRDADGAKIHLQTLCGIAGLDYNQVATHDYSQYLGQIDRLGLGAAAMEQAWRRMVLNVAAANCDDHTKNFSFLYTPARRLDPRACLRRHLCLQLRVGVDPPTPHERQRAVSEHHPRRPARRRRPIRRAVGALHPRPGSRRRRAVARGCRRCRGAHCDRIVDCRRPSDGRVAK